MTRGFYAKPSLIPRRASPLAASSLLMVSCGSMFYVSERP